jgi:hypothetical protein
MKKIFYLLSVTFLLLHSCSSGDSSSDGDNAKIVLKNNYWENSPNYNRETDPFFKRLITKLNNR